MPSAGKSALGIGSSIAGGAATGAAFGPIGAGIGAGVGGLLGLIGAGQASEEEEELKRQQQQAKKNAITQALRNRAASLGAPTDRADMELTQQGINNQYNAGMDRLNTVTPADYGGLLQSLASVGGAASKGKWLGGSGKPTGQGPLVRNSDLYGGADSTGLARTGSDPYAPLGDPAFTGKRRR